MNQEKTFPSTNLIQGQHAPCWHSSGHAAEIVEPVESVEAAVEVEVSVAVDVDVVFVWLEEVEVEVERVLTKYWDCAWPSRCRARCLESFF